MHETFSPFGISYIEWDLENIDLVCGYRNYGDPVESLGGPMFGLLGLDGNALADTGTSPALRGASSTVGDNLRDVNSSEFGDFASDSPLTISFGPPIADYTYRVHLHKDMRDGEEIPSHVFNQKSPYVAAYQPSQVLP
ncbi:unnamed protein product [Linum trigynum]|uniref:Uncharacterized protein n=1 Tax=Linum trigynum TaxID=586398 RepID=A0AAV2FUA7_9ROSI